MPPQAGPGGRRFGPPGQQQPGQAGGPPGRPGAPPAPPPANAGVAPNMQAAPLAPSGAPAPQQQQQLRPIAPTAVGQGLTPQSAQGQPLRNMGALRGERRETTEGGRQVFREPDRTIIRENGRTFIRHSDTTRFAYGARDVVTARRGVTNVTTVVLPTGDRIINIVDDNGYLIRRSRILPGGREIILIDNRPRGRDWSPANFFLSLAAPVIRIPRERYIVDYDRYDRDPRYLYDTLMAPPVELIDRPYTLDEVRYNAPLRDRMPRIDLNTVNFESGSWELTDDQIDKLGAIADGLNQVISRNPRAVFLIEGHTDATGNDVDNLSLSDRRAESVAIALSQQFGVPAENLTTQGYGEQYLKVPTQGPSPENRRVAVRNITPLLTGQAGGPPPR
jgi:outer membrane protein OmpA-like peptidoglycan-associated protein